ncbi:MAG: threonine synthase [Candidatus Binatia bacterium]
MTFATHLACPSCGRTFPLRAVINLCLCGSPLLVRYDLEKMMGSVKKPALKGRPPTLWRYREWLPLRNLDNCVSLDEGFTPLIDVPRLADDLKLSKLFVKDESRNPTGSFKDRGLSLAVSMAYELGLRKVAIPSAGNAAGSLAAYAARVGMEAHVFMPADAPQANQIEVIRYGAKLTLIDGLISDCGRLVAEGREREGWFDISTLKEPYRLEGKKTIGLEIAEQLNWGLPDVILYPTGGGTGLIGMWKAFNELQEMGWVAPKRPRMVSVQAEGCAPIVRALNRGKQRAEAWPNARTLASGLRVPQSVGDFLILEAIRLSRGTAVSVTDEEMITEINRVARIEGLWFCPESGASVAALRRLAQEGWVKRDETVLLLNTASGLKYADLLYK